MSSGERDQVWIVWYDLTDAHRGDHDEAANGVRAALPADAHGKLVWLYATADAADHLDFARAEAHADHSRLLAVVVLGTYLWWEEWSADQTGRLEALKRFISTTEVPLIAFGGGHQLVAKAFAARDGRREPVVHMFHSDEVGDLPREADYNQEHDLALAMALSGEGKSDPIFGGRSSPRYMLFHHDKVRDLHPDFKLLASTALCQIQAVRHKTRLIYTTQFHPELEGTSDGRPLVAQFFSQARAYWENR